VRNFEDIKQSVVAMTIQEEKALKWKHHEAFFSNDSNKWL